MSKWSNIPGFAGRYQITKKGRVRSLTRITKHSGRHVRVTTGHELKPYLHCGYLAVELGSGIGRAKRCLVHRLVYLTFCGAIPGELIVRHLDDAKHNNHPRNLALGTKQDNANDRRKNKGYCVKGCSPKSVLTKAQVYEVIYLVHCRKQSCVSVAKRVGCSVHVVYGISSGRSRRRLLYETQNSNIPVMFKILSRR